MSNTHSPLSNTLTQDITSKTINATSGNKTHTEPTSNAPAQHATSNIINHTNRNKTCSTPPSNAPTQCTLSSKSNPTIRNETCSALQQQNITTSPYAPLSATNLFSDQTSSARKINFDVTLAPANNTPTRKEIEGDVVEIAQKRKGKGKKLCDHEARKKLKMNARVVHYLNVCLELRYDCMMHHKETMCENNMSNFEIQMSAKNA